MALFFISFAGFSLALLAMAVGVLLTGRRIQGSCGGLSNALTNTEGDKVCGICGIPIEADRPRPCDPGQAKKT